MEKCRLLKLIEFVQKKDPTAIALNDCLDIRKRMVLQDMVVSQNVVIWELIEGLLYSSTSEFGSSNFEDRVQVTMSLRVLLNLYNDSDGGFKDAVLKEPKLGFSLGVGDEKIKSGMIQFILAMLDDAGIIEMGDSSEGDTIWDGWLTEEGEILLELLNAYDFEK